MLTVRSGAGMTVLLFLHVLSSLRACFHAGGDVAVIVFAINQPSLPTPFHSVLVSLSVFMALSDVFHSIIFPDNSPLSHSVLRSYLCLIGLFNYISFCKSLQP